MKFTIYSTYLLLALMASQLVFGQVADNFDDGDFSMNPTWTGDDTEFEVSADGRLHLVGPDEASESSLVTASAAIENAAWEFTVNLEFNPSSGNRAYVYLVSSSAGLEADLNGYYVMIGNTDDEISLYRQDGGTSSKIIDGSDDLVDLDPVNVRVRVTRDAAGNWELLRDVDLTGSFVTEGTIQDETHANSAYFGVRCDYTATRSEAFYFDDIAVSGTAVADTEAPELNSLTVIDNTTLELVFSEPMDLANAENTNAYTWLPATNPMSAALSGQTVTLSFDLSFPSNETQQLQLDGLSDLAGNLIEGVTVPFTHYVVGIASEGAVLINELMSDPNPVLSTLPELEYIELYNNSDQAYDLEGWILNDSGSEQLLPSYILAPGAYLIICDNADVNTFQIYGEVLGSSISLSNAADSIALISEEGLSIDVVDYSLSWYGGTPFDDGGYSLERINPNLSCSDENNWAACSASLGGTPGTQNSIYNPVDDVAPSLARVEVIYPDAIKLIFSEGMDALSLILGSYSLSPASTLVPELSSTSSAELLLQMTPQPIPGEFYTLDYSGMTDCSGNPIADGSISFYATESPEFGDVIFHELMVNPSDAIGLPEVEYIELYNRSDKVFDLNAWGYTNGASIQSLPAHTLLPGDFVLLCDADDAAELESYGAVLGILNFTSLGNTSDELGLTDPEGIVVDAVDYNNSWYRDNDRDDGGYSLELISPNLPCSWSGNWRACQVEAGGTPNALNSVYDPSPDLSAPVACFVVPSSSGQLLSISFSEPIDAESLDLEDFVFTPSLSLLGASADGLNAQVALDEPLLAGTIYTLSISGISDCSGNEMTGSQELVAGIAEEAQEGDLLINEVLFNPKTGGYDFVEIYNHSDRIINLEGWKLANRENGQLDDAEVISEGIQLIFPGEFKVMTENVTDVIYNYPYGNSKNYIETNIPSYADDEGYVVLLAPQEGVHDEFYYNDDYQFALLDDKNGVSLERIDYSRLSNDPSNWHSAAERVGFATPGYENSQLQPANISSESFFLEPDVFTPDNDGEQDNLLISYSLPQAGSVANIRIYDRDGRLIRNLRRNELLASRGTISWDGIRDDGSKARIGVYIVLIELFDVEGNTSSSKKTCVLGGRL